MWRLREWVRRICGMLSRRRPDRDLEDELRIHLQLATEAARQRGDAPEKALRAARLRSGGIPQAMEALRDQRGLPWLEDLWTDLRYAARTLRRAPGFTATVVLMFALGIGATTAIFSVVDRVLLEPLPYDEPGRLIRLYQADYDDPTELSVVSAVHFTHYRDQMASFEDLAAIYNYRETGADVETNGGAERIRVLYTTASYFDVLRTPPVRGRAFRRSEESEVPPVMSDDRQNEPSQSAVVILSDHLWRRQFHGNPSVIGQTLRLSAVPRTVIGVMPAGFVDPVVGGVDAWLPLNMRPGGSNNPGNRYLSVLGRLRSGTALETARAELATLDRALTERYAEQSDDRAYILPLHEDLVRPASRTLQVLLGAVGFVLLLVCVNIANLLFVRAVTRTRELAVRSALGSGRGRIVRQLLAESLCLAVAGGAAGLLVAKIATAGLVAFGAASIPRIGDVSYDKRVLLFAVAVSLLSALLAGLAPTLGASRTASGNALREWSRLTTAGRRPRRTRAGLVVTQVALALVLLVGSGLFIASLYHLQQVDLGVRTDNVLTFEVHLPALRYDAPSRARFHEELVRRLERLPGVQNAGAVSKLPATGSYHGWPTRALTGPLAGSEDEASTGAQQRVVEGDYFTALSIPILDGRTFDERDNADAPPRVMVSRALAERLFPGADAVGETISVLDDPAEVIGVVGDVALDPEGRVEQYVFHSHRQVAANRNWALTYTVATSIAPEGLISAARRELAALDPRLVLYEPATLDAVVGRGTAQQRFTTAVLASFAATALGLAVLGLFGVLSYSVRQRRRELGVRMALGARSADVRRLVLRHGAALTGGGIAIGLAASVALTWMLASLLFEVSPLDPVAFAAAAFLLGGSALVASWLPARRAAAVDPMTVLREE